MDRVLLELFATPMGTRLEYALVFLYQVLLKGDTVAGDAGFTNEAGDLPFWDGGGVS